MRKYLVLYEKSQSSSYGAYMPDLPGCTSAGKDRSEVEQNTIEAAKLHIEVLESEGLPIPEPNSDSEMLFLA